MDNTCRICGGRLRLSMIPDHVGRRTTDFRWTHAHHPEDGHTADPRWIVDDGNDRPVAVCGDCGQLLPVHPAAADQRGEPVCYRCAAAGGLA